LNPVKGSFMNTFKYTDFSHLILTSIAGQKIVKALKR
jgi:hypothetical protein